MSDDIIASLPAKELKHYLALRDPGRLSANPAAVYIASLPSPQSQRTMKTALNQIAAVLKFKPVTVPVSGARKHFEEITYLHVQWAALHYQFTSAIRARLIERYAPATVNKLLAALKGVLKECWRLNLMAADDYHLATDFKGVKGKTLPAGRDLSNGEIMALSNACLADLSAAGARDAALIAVLSIGGLRRSEVTALDLADLDPESGKLNVRHGKGDKARTVYISNGALGALLDWLDVRGDEPGPLFHPVLKSGKISRTRMTAQAIYNLLEKRGKQAGLDDFSPHDFRRTFAGDLLDAGVDISTVSKLMGHANVETTGRYDRRPEEIKKQAAAKLHFPYQRRRKLV